MFATKSEVFDFLCETNWSFFRRENLQHLGFTPTAYQFTLEFLFKDLSNRKYRTYRLYETVSHLDSLATRIDPSEDQDFQRFMQNTIPPFNNSVYTRLPR